MSAPTVSKRRLRLTVTELVIGLFVAIVLESLLKSVIFDCLMVACAAGLTTIYVMRFRRTRQYKEAGKLVFMAALDLALLALIFSTNGRVLLITLFGLAVMTLVVWGSLFGAFRRHNRS